MDMGLLYASTIFSAAVPKSRTLLKNNLNEVGGEYKAMKEPLCTTSRTQSVCSSYAS